MADPCPSLGEAAPKLPEVFRHRPELISPYDEPSLIARYLPFRELESHGYAGKRRTVFFGWHYDFSDRQLRNADDIPGFLLPVRRTRTGGLWRQARRWQL